jgi:ArsR family transcriptional regulator
MESLDAVRVLGALAQETRLGIFRILVEAGPQGLAAGRIAETLELPQPTLSFHLKELTHAGLVSARSESRFIYYSANYDRMIGLVDFLTANCCQGNAAACKPAGLKRRRLTSAIAVAAPSRRKRRAAVV